MIGALEQELNWIEFIETESNGFFYFEISCFVSKHEAPSVVANLNNAN